MVFPSLPEDLPVRPAAAWEVEALEAGASTLEVTYLTAGPTWSADYVATLNPQQDHVQLTAWVTVDNQTAVPYADARLALVAGEVRRVAAPPRLMAGRMQAEAMDAHMVAEAGFSEAPGGDYHVYRLGRRIQLPARSVRQLVLHEAGQVPVRRRFVVRSGGLMGGGRSGPDRPLRLPVESRLELDNSADAGLGVPLPAGVARVYLEGEDGERLFLGEDRWPALARDEEVSLATGASFDLVAERTQTGYLRKPGDQRGYEASFQYDLRNRGIEDRTIDIRDSFPGSWKLLDSSHASSRPDAATLAFRIDVPAGGEVRVTYRVSGR